MYIIKDAGNKEKFETWAEVLTEFDNNHEMWGLSCAPTERKIEEMLNGVGDIIIIIEE